MIFIFIKLSWMFEGICKFLAIKRLKLHQFGHLNFKNTCKWRFQEIQMIINSERPGCEERTMPCVLGIVLQEVYKPSHCSCRLVSLTCIKKKKNCAGPILVSALIDFCKCPPVREASLGKN